MSLQFSTLENGDRMTRAEFHHIYETMAEDFKAELIGGIVYVGSRIPRLHGTNHVRLASLLSGYASQTPGVEAAGNATVLLGDDAEPQPDLHLRILPEYGGQSRTTDDDYVEGAPELVIEIALSSRAIDLHAKRDDYHRYGVLEYLVVCLKEGELHWFDLRADRELNPDADGILRIRSFPGLWIDRRALLADDHARLLRTLEQGLITPEHAEFVRLLAAARRPSES